MGPTNFDEPNWRCLNKCFCFCIAFKVWPFWIRNSWWIVIQILTLFFWFTKRRSCTGNTFLKLEFNESRRTCWFLPVAWRITYLLNNTISVSTAHDLSFHVWARVKWPFPMSKAIAIFYLKMPWNKFQKVHKSTQGSASNLLNHSASRNVGDSILCSCTFQSVHLFWMQKFWFPSDPCSGFVLCI